MTTDQEKIEAIHNYIVENIEYDNSKYATLDSTYVPNPNQVLSAKSGICYDYASVFAAMSRSLDIPTKLVKGYKNDITEYHAWNQVLINGEWLTIDCTYNATLYANHYDTTVVMNAHNYSIKKAY